MLGAFLILPALFALQSVVSDRFGKSFRSTIALGIMALAILLAFSRAAWGGLVITSAFMLALMVADQPVARAALAHHRDGGGRGHRRGGADRACCCRSTPIGEMFKQRASFDQSYDEGRFGRFGRHILGAADGARSAVRHRPAAVPQLLPRRHPQFLSERLHVRRLDRRHLLSGAGVHHRHHGISARLRPRALAARLSRDLRGVPRHRRRKLRHRHRPLAALLDDAGRDVGHVRRRAALQGGRLDNAFMAPQASAS